MIAVAALLAVAANGGATTTADAKWVPADLGTLGGDSSYASDVNDRGQVVGVSRTAGGARHVFFWERGSMRDLGVFATRDWDGGPKINERGQVVWNVNGRRGVLWSEGVKRDLGFFVTGLDDRGRVVGSTGSQFLTSSRPERGVLWEDGRLRRLDLLGGYGPADWRFPKPYGGGSITIGPRGTVAGTTKVFSGGNSVFLWREGKRTLLGGESEALAINGKGQVLAVCRRNTAASHVCLWDGKRWRRVAPWRDVGSGAPTAVLGEREDVAGTRCGGGTCPAFLWRSGRTIGLGVLWRKSWVAGVDRARRVAGTSRSFGDRSRAFVWERGERRFLTPADRHSTAWAMNDVGQIVGSMATGARPQGAQAKRHAVVWTRQG